MTTQTFTATASPYRFAGRTAIASGAIGILAYMSLIGYLVYRNQVRYLGDLMIRTHDVGVILQFLFMIPVAFGLHKLSQKRSPGMNQAMLTTGIAALSFTILFLLLIFPKLLADTLYMFPQGVFGVWLMIVCWRLPGILSPGLRWFGIAVGLGLALVGTFPPGFAIFVDTIVLRIPAASDVAQANVPMTSVNKILHQILWIGSFMGVLTLPSWTILIGRRLLREKSF